MSEYSVKGVFSPSSGASLLDRKAFSPLKSPFSENQSAVDHLVGHSLQSASDGKTLFAFLGAGLAGNWIRLGALSSSLPSWALQGLSQIAGLAGESAVFTSLEQGWTRGGSLARGFPKNWAQAALQLGCIKGLGRLGRAENLLTQHLLIDTGMVTAHNLAYAAGWTFKPQGSLAQQLLEAEGTTLNMKASLALLHLGMPRLSALEKTIEKTLQIKTPSNAWNASPLLEWIPEGAPLSTEKSLRADKGWEIPWMAMSSLDSKEGGSAKPSRWESKLRSWRSERRRMAAVELGREKAETSRLKLEERLLKDSSWEVRGAAAVALGKIGDFRSTPVLLQTSRSDPQPEVREAAVYALGIAGDPTAVPELIKTFHEKLASLALRYLEEERLKKSGKPRLTLPNEEYEDYLTEATAVALGRIGSPDAILELRSSLLHPYFLANISALEGLSLAKNLSEREEIEFWIEKAERKFSADQEKMDRAIQKYMADLPLSLLEQNLLDEANARHTALLIGIPTLGRLKDPASAPLLLDLLENGDVDFKVPAAQALTELEDPHSRSLLGRALTHPLAEIRVAATLALAKKGDPLARTFLSQILNDKPDPKTTDFEAREVILTLRSADLGPKLLPGHAAKGPRGFSDQRYEKMGIDIRD